MTLTTYRKFPAGPGYNFSSQSVPLSLTETLPEGFKLEENETIGFELDWVKS